MESSVMEDAGRESNERLHEGVPMVWVSSLAAYNHGTLHGRWIEAAREADEVWEDVNAILESSPVPGEEYLIADHEGFAGVTIWEYERIERVAEIARHIVNHGEAFGLWLTHEGSDALERADGFEDAYEGSFSDREEMLDHIDMNFGPRELMDEIERVVRHPLSAYVEFDLEAFVNDMDCNGDIYTVETNRGLHLFKRT